jgi:hypothetical protein
MMIGTEYYIRVERGCTGGKLSGMSCGGKGVYVDRNANLFALPVV